MEKGAFGQVFRVFGDIFSRPFELLLTANETIPVFALPEFAASFEMLVDFVGGETFEGMNQVFQDMPLSQL